MQDLNARPEADRPGSLRFGLAKHKQTPCAQRTALRAREVRRCGDAAEQDKEVKKGSKEAFLVIGGHQGKDLMDQTPCFFCAFTLFEKQKWLRDAVSAKIS
jgi:hypothetical protein